MLKEDLRQPWSMKQNGGFIEISDCDGVVIMQYYEPEASQRVKSIFQLLHSAPELYEAAKEMIDLKSKLWYQGLDEIEQGVFNSVLANLEITIEKIESEASHGA